MKIQDPSFEIIIQFPGIAGIYKQIERAGRICYKSEDKITENSAKKFVDNLIKSNHLSVLEHGTIYLTVDKDNPIVEWYENNAYSKVIINRGYAYITTNARVITENELQEDLKYLVSVPVLHEQRITVLINTQIAISREFNRHRKFSISEQSTRYCNYSKDKFGNEITICRSVEWNNKPNTEIDWVEWANAQCEKAYMQLIKLGYSAQEARVVLPLNTATQVVYTGFISDWKHFFDLRSDTAQTGKPHPEACYIATKLRKVFKEKGYIQ